MRSEKTSGYPGKRTPGRTRYTKELGRYICERIAEGEGLVAVAREIGVPKRTVSGWVKKYTGFAEDYARACETRLCLMEERILELCEEAREAGESGAPDARVRIEAAKLQINTLQWTLARLLPARWGEKNKLEVCDRVVGAINACPQNAPIASGLGKVPAECKRTAIVLARHAAISAVPAMHQALEGETRHDEYNSATADLAALAACDLLPMYELEEEESAIDAESAPGIGVMGKESPDWLI